jgi:hypothetical protein
MVGRTLFEKIGLSVGSRKRRCVLLISVAVTTGLFALGPMVRAQDAAVPTDWPVQVDGGMVAVDGGAAPETADAGAGDRSDSNASVDAMAEPEAPTKVPEAVDNLKMVSDAIAKAPEGQPSVISIARSQPAQPREPHLARWGLATDVGLSGIMPDAALLLAMRPVPWLRMHAGGAYNGFALGVRGGASLVNPFVIPLSLTCEGGHFFEGDANKAVRWFTSDVQDIASLRRFSYDYLNVMGGLEMQGHHLGFYVRGGLTWMRTTIKDFEQSVHDVAQVDLQASDPKVSYRGPTLRLGTTYFY